PDLRHVPLDEDPRGPERERGFGPGGGQRERRLRRFEDQADAPAPAAARRLDYVPRAPRLGVRGGSRPSGHDRSGPRRHVRSDLHDQQLGGSLVSEPPDGLAAWMDEHYRGRLAALGERRLLGHYAPADTDGVRPGGAGLRDHQLLIEVRGSTAAV